MYSSIITASAVTVVIDGIPNTICKADDVSRFNDVVSAIINDDEPELTRLVNPNLFVEDVIKTLEANVVVYRNRIIIDGQVLQGYVIKRLVEAIQNDLPYEALLNFVKRLRMNPSYRANQDLYEFLEIGKMSLLPDGRVLAYKVICGNFLDIHSGTFDNSPGKIVAMSRADVDDNPNKTCSNGLHVCSPEYLSHFGANCDTRVVVLVAVCPSDFVSFPRDYNQSKARVCEYEVLCVIDQEDLKNLDTRIGSDWRFQIDYQDPITYPNLAKALKTKGFKKFKKLRRAVDANMVELENSTDIKVIADLNLWKAKN